MCDVLIAPMPSKDACGKQYESDKKSNPTWSCCKKDRFPKKASRQTAPSSNPESEVGRGSTVLNLGLCCGQDEYLVGIHSSVPIKSCMLLNRADSSAVPKLGTVG